MLIPEKLLGIIRCVSCESPALVVRDRTIVCENCAHAYEIVNGIPDLRPVTPLKLPEIYNDPDYRKWLDYQAEAKKYFYESSGAMAYVQNAGHRNIKSLRGTKRYGITLDLGCGDAHHYPYLTGGLPGNAGECCFGIDFDQKALENAQKKYPDLPLIRGDVYRLPVKDDGVDCIVSVYNCEHLVYLDLALEEMIRIMAPGGELYISIPTEGSLAWKTGRKLTTARSFRGLGMDYERAQEIDHINAVWQLDKAFKRHFKIIRRKFFPFPVPVFHANLVVTYRCVPR